LSVWGEHFLQTAFNFASIYTVVFEILLSINACVVKAIQIARNNELVTRICLHPSPDIVHKATVQHWRNLKQAVIGRSHFLNKFNWILSIFWSEVQLVHQGIMKILPSHLTHFMSTFEFTKLQVRQTCRNNAHTYAQERSTHDDLPLYRWERTAKQLHTSGEGTEYNDRQLHTGQFTLIMMVRRAM